MAPMLTDENRLEQSVNAGLDAVNFLAMLLHHGRQDKQAAEQAWDALDKEGQDECKRRLAAIIDTINCGTVEYAKLVKLREAMPLKMPLA